MADLQDSTLPPPDAAFWKRKLAAFLHDSPSKALDIRNHEERASAAYIRAGLEDYIRAYDHTADHIAAAADRVPFPCRQITCHFDGVENRFHHPLSCDAELSPAVRSLSVVDAEETEGTLQPQLSLPAFWNDGLHWRAQFFAHWRLWRRNCSDNNPALSFLPADTRLPDHTIWQHMGVVSALAGTHGKPAFLKLQLGPVQEFIAAARSTRDLWSGSYLLSWLMATGLAALAREIGPDSVIFPSLYGQPIFDQQFREELWAVSRITAGASESVWESLGHQPDDLLTPNLPNVFLAVVPASRATEIAATVEKAIRNEWTKIADYVWEFAREIIRDEFSPRNAHARFKSQVARQLDLAWQTTPWPSTPDEALSTAERFLPNARDGKANPSCSRLRAFIRYFNETMPRDHRDGRYYVGGKDGPKERLNSTGLAWSVLVALNGWQLDAARQTRAFPAWSTGGWENGSTHNSKDALTGREEMIVGGQPWFDSLPGKWKKLFRHADDVGAITLIKRTWHLAYLENVHGLPASPERGFRMPNTQEIAGRQQDEADADPEDVSSDLPLYFAVLALDGDSIGKIVSGESTPRLGAQLADYGTPPNRYGARIYFEQNGGEQLLDLQRPLSPSFHLQFSEALSNFSLHCVRPIIEAHQGKVLYAGGDDVLAMLPAGEAIVCADALQRAFRGDEPTNQRYKLHRIAPGFLSRTDRLTHDKKPIPFVVPGPSCTASVGIAIAHAKAPLQDVVREAQRAERRAKNVDGKHAIAVTVLKRSGEITEWAGRFGHDLDGERGGSLGLSAFWWMLHAINDEEVLSRKFPHRLIEVLQAYCSPEKRPGGATSAIQDLTADTFDLPAVLAHELRTVLSRQQGKNWNVSPNRSREIASRLEVALHAYFADTSGTVSERLRQLIALLTVTSFLLRNTD